MRSLESGGKDVSGAAGGGSRVEDGGLERGGAGKREYFGFLASIVVKRFGGKVPCRRSMHGPKRESGARGWEMQEGEWVK